ncbi:RraA family protein [Ancylobacter vacuolatus]|uniref:Regulator of RNase E activity RraA n=1 Tax=Ancylobacter vacuolatus TaxID=223389 RepID=A0ABU0DKF3_9HYPH|nr:RraA family protein [Ancylobacter vacuolatus]MDQ0348715.1 regulator of RNase E activity RraA [Ancylobacter vacuolatus]
MPNDVLDLDAIKTTLYTAVLSDVLDDFGLPNQAMAPFVRPLDEGKKLVGYARTGLFMNTYSVREGENPYEIEIALIDDLKPNDVAVLGCAGPTQRIAPWGELLTTASMKRGAVGCVTDGLVRDVRHIRSLGFPVFHGGIGPLDSRGRGKMMAYDLPIQCGGVSVKPGDLVFGDVDGVVVVPKEVSVRVVEAAMRKVTSENKTRQELENGLLLADVYAKYGVL